MARLFYWGGRRKRRQRAFLKKVRKNPPRGRLQRWSGFGTIDGHAAEKRVAAFRAAAYAAFCSVWDIAKMFGFSSDGLDRAFSASPLCNGLDARDFGEQRLCYVMDRLREERERQGLTLQRLGLISGISKIMIAKMEKGERSPSLIICLRVADALGLQLGDLLNSVPKGKRK